jgi:endonuclease/exonuclease/phosphatase (EEP) superfamily protein YafD
MSNGIAALAKLHPLRILLLVLMIPVLIEMAGCIVVPDEFITVGQSDQTDIVSKCCDNDLSLPALDDFSAERSHVLGTDDFNLLNWNILKGFKSGWKSDFKQLSAKSDLLVIQEARLTGEMQELLQNGRYYWNLAAAYKYRNVKTGVLTASKIKPAFRCSMRVDEPLLSIPKTFLINLYPISNSDQFLLVANVHSVNFTLGVAQYRIQWQKLEKALSKHRGPIILSGDFNSWNKERKGVVKSVTQRLKLKPVIFEADHRVTFFDHPVDHIYYRGLKPVKALVHKVETSDHNPMLVTFRPDRSPKIHSIVQNIVPFGRVFTLVD